MSFKVFHTAIFSAAALAGQLAWAKVDMEEVREHFAPLPKLSIDVEKKAKLIALGKRLYLEKGLSINNQISCNTCHQLDNFGVDNEPTSPGHEGKRGDRNSPSSYYAWGHNAQFWDGRAKDVEEQAGGPILNPVEMGMPSEASVIAKLKTLNYMDEFKAAFPGESDPLTYENLKTAIGGFERTLNPRSRFDDFLDGDIKALTAAERKGLSKFIEVGCVQCHNGAFVGGNDYQKLGLVNPYENEDLGRYHLTKKEEDKHVFKVPSLRNVTRTAPYFHDGKVETIEEAVRLMAYHQLGEELSKEDIRLIVGFLKSLQMKPSEVKQFL